MQVVGLGKDRERMLETIGHCKDGTRDNDEREELSTRVNVSIASSLTTRGDVVKPASNVRMRKRRKVRKLKAEKSGAHGCAGIFGG